MKYTPAEITHYIDIITKIAEISPSDTEAVRTILNNTSLKDGKTLSKSKILQIYKELKKDEIILLSPESEEILYQNLKKKFIRSLSGVTTVTVLTMPYPCPGKCIFCPNDVRMPKSYIASEPGAQRALANKFDPYLQTFNRLVALHNNGHPTDKIELIVLGGTWTFYPIEYRKWFIYRCFQALNDFKPQADPQSLSTEQIPLPLDTQGVEDTVKEKDKVVYNEVIAKNVTMPNTDVSWDQINAEFTKNENASARCVGLSLETRPDEITYDTAIELRKLGATKVQLGVQVLDDTILSLNKRNQSVETIATAFNILRQMGFKIQIHWMPNLLGSNPQKDLEMYIDLFSNEKFKPDELKIYPCSLIPNTELNDYYNDKKWIPYSNEILVNLIVDYIKNTPRYCRITRIIRDIPSDEIAAGNTQTNLRQAAERILTDSNSKIVEIRAREIKTESVNIYELSQKVTKYETTNATEYFIEFVTSDDKLAGFLRLSIPKTPSFIDELAGSGIIREIHVYGQSLVIGSSSAGKAQHIGLGTKLIEKAQEIANQEGFTKLSVISAIGTREYYRKKGFFDGTLYQHKVITI